MYNYTVTITPSNKV